MLMIFQNQRSIDVFACSRDLDWRGPLFKYAHLGIKELDEVLEPAPKIWEEHPHHIVQTLKKTLKRPSFQGNSQIHIDETIMDSPKWEGKGGMVDPTLRMVPEWAEGDDDRYCALCGSPDICACELDFLPGSMVELVDRPETGTGIRALMGFKKGTILGEFIGEICPPDYLKGEVYSLRRISSTNNDKARAIISPANYGNWTRFLAHSCNSSTEFVPRTIGNRIMMTVEASRDISAFEDITINYGPEYWKDMECLCGEENCVSKKK
jgi:hypothetical protein